MSVDPTRLDDLTPREMGMGLMRGNREELKLGYDAQNAYLAVLNVKGELEENDSIRLISFLLGFGEGLNRIQPTSSDRFEQEFQEGYRAGLGEDSFRTNPARIEGEPTSEGIMTVPDGGNR